MEREVLLALTFKTFQHCETELMRNNKGRKSKRRTLIYQVQKMIMSKKKFLISYYVNYCYKSNIMRAEKLPLE